MLAETGRYTHKISHYKYPKEYRMLNPTKSLLLMAKSLFFPHIWFNDEPLLTHNSPLPLWPSGNQTWQEKIFQLTSVIFPWNQVKPLWHGDVPGTFDYRRPHHSLNHYHHCYIDISHQASSFSSSHQYILTATYRNQHWVLTIGHCIDH